MNEIKKEEMKFSELNKDINGDLEIWPALRSDYTGATIVFNNAKGVFRLSTNITSWSINNASTYGISFEAVEAIV